MLKPKGKFPSWMDFILDDENKPAILEVTTRSGWMRKGVKVRCWGKDITNQYYAVFSVAGNQVWQHKRNFQVIERGTVL